MPRIASARIPTALAVCALTVAACVDDPAPSPDTASAALVADATRTTATLRRQLAELAQGGVLDAEVQFVAGIDDTAALDAVRSAGASTDEQRMRFGRVLAVRGDAAALRALAAHPAVAVLAEAPAPNVSRWDGTGLPAPRNADSRDSHNADEISPGGDLGFDLTGDGIVLGIVDGGRLRASHADYEGRAEYFDSDSAFDDHATHVGGTMIGAGVIRDDARGFAPGARLFGWNFNRDTVDLLASVSGRFMASNHSYGFDLGWDRYGRWVGDEGFGVYSLTASRADEAIHDLDIIWIKAAGNDRGDGQGSSSADRPWDCESGYDCISGDGLAKNMILVASIGDLNADPALPGSARVSDFSSRGPADDGRVKPDIAANGEGLLSLGTDSDTAYIRQSGTSMASPSVTGGVALLLEQARDVLGRDLGAAELRALLIHTALRNADDGRPDAGLGWGVMDLAAAATWLQDAADDALETHGIYDGTTTEMTVSPGASELALTLAWLDPAGRANTGPVDDPTPALVHDLDLSVRCGSTTFHPWRMDLAALGTPRNDGPNHVDNIERIVVPAGAAGGSCTVTIDHTGDIDGDGQAWVLLSSHALGGRPDAPMLGGVRTVRISVRNDEPPRTVELPLAPLAGDEVRWSLDITGAPFWLDADVSAGTAPAAVPRVIVDAAGLSPGLRYATVWATNDDDASASPRAIHIVLDVRGLEFPTAEAGEDRSVPSGALVSLAGIGSDPDGGDIAWAWEQTSGPPVELNNADTFRPSFVAPDVDADSVLTFELVISNDTLSSAPDDVQVTVLPVVGADEPANNRCATAPLVRLPFTGGGVLDRRHDVDFYRFAASEGEVVTAGTFRRGGAIDTTIGVFRIDGTLLASDDDGGAGLYSNVSTELTGAAEFCVAVSTYGDFAFDGAAAGDDGEYGLTIALDRENVPPVADAGDDITVEEGAVVALDATGSEDPDGISLAWAWTQTSGPDVSLDSDVSPRPRFFAPDVDAETTLGFSVRVTDVDEASATDEVTVTVTPVAGALPLYVDAGNDRVVPSGASTRLTARASEAAVGAVWTWTVVDGPAPALVTSDASVAFDAPVVTEPTDITLQARATIDPFSGTDNVVVRVIPTTGADEPDNNACATAPLVGRSARVVVSETLSGELAPQHDVDAVRVAVLEGSTYHFEVLPNGPRIDTTLGLFRETVDGWTLLAVDDDSGQATFSRLDGESDADGQLCAVISHARDIAFDGADADGSGPWAFDVEIIPPEGANLPPVADAGVDVTVDPGVLYTLDGSGSIDPEGERLDYRWRLVDGPRTVDLFDPIAARSAVALPNDLAETAEFTFELSVFDGAWEDTDTVTITVRANGAPTLDDIARVEVDLGEQARFVATAADPDGETVTLLADELPDGATFDPATGEFVWTTDRAGFFTPRVEARDPWGAFDETFVVVLVVDRSAENRPPRIAPIDDVVVRVSEAPTEVTLNAEAIDEDGDPLDWLWQREDGTLLGTTPSVQSLFDWGRTGVMLSVSDGEATSIEMFDVVIEPDGPLPPLADAGIDQRLRPRSAGDRETTVTLDGRASIDPSGRPLRFVWEQTGGRDVELARADEAVATFSQPEGEGELTFDLVVIADDGGDEVSSAPDGTVVTIAPSVDNAQPGAFIDGPETAAEGRTEAYSGSLSEDPEGAALSWRWSVSRGDAQIDDPEAAEVEVTFGAPSDDGWELLLTVHDGLAVSAPARRRVLEAGSVTNEAPRAVAALDGTPVAGTLVRLDASGSSDPDGDALSFAWTQTGGPALSLSADDAEVATLRLAALPGDQVSYRVTVSDGEFEDTDEVSFVVLAEASDDIGVSDVSGEADAGDSDASVGDDQGDGGGSDGGCMASSGSHVPAWWLVACVALPVGLRRRKRIA